MNRSKHKNPVLESNLEYYNTGYLENVDVNEERMRELGDELVDEYDFEVPNWNAPVFPSVEDEGVETVVDFLVLGNALNYCFNDVETGEKFAVEYIGTDWAGAFGMWASLKKALENDELELTTEFLTSVDRDNIRSIFAPCNGVEIPMIESRIEQMRSVGEILSDVGSVYSLFEDREVSVYGEEGVVEILSGYEAFEDIRTHSKFGDLRFDKRSQLAVSMIYGKLRPTEYSFEVSDMDEFSVFADYGIPAGLFAHGVLEYDDELENSIRNQQVVLENSSEEIDLRVATVIAGEILKEHLKHEDVNAIIPAIDYVLWQMRKEADTHTHITVTTAY